MKHLVVPFELKAISDREIEGYGSVFGNVDLGGDIVIPGAFAKSLGAHKAAGTKPKMLWNHRQSDLPIGVWDHFEEDGKGLYMKGRFADTQMGNDVRTLARMKAIDSMSIGYTTSDAEFSRDGYLLLKEVDLWEVSPVNFPMNPQAVIAAVKSQYPDPRAFERYLKDAGCSNRTAKTLVSEVLKSTSVMGEDSDCDDPEEELLRELKAREDLLLAGLIQSKLRNKL